MRSFTLWAPLAAVVLLPQLALATSDPFIGTWVLDPQRSRYESAEVPRHMEIVMSPAGEGIHYWSQTTLSDGRIVSSEYTADYEGRLAVVVSAAGIMAPVSLRRVDDRTVECSYIKGIRVVASSRRVISADGSTMTITTVDGTTGTNVAVFNRRQ
jgi:surface antigen